jgi:acyl-CoA synthetase (AMP-forming)/AMP-acid ligase II
MASLPARLDQAIEPWAERTPDAPALAEAERTWTYAELARHVAFLRGWLGQQGIRGCVRARAPVCGVAAVGKWPAGATIKG